MAAGPGRSAAGEMAENRAGADGWLVPTTGGVEGGASGELGGRMDARGNAVGSEEAAVGPSVVAGGRLDAEKGAAVGPSVVAGDGLDAEKGTEGAGVGRRCELGMSASGDVGTAAAGGIGAGVALVPPPTVDDGEVGGPSVGSVGQGKSGEEGAETPGARIGEGAVRSLVLTGACAVVRSGDDGDIGKGDARPPMVGGGAMVRSGDAGRVGRADGRSALAGACAVVRSGTVGRIGSGDGRSPVLTGTRGCVSGGWNCGSVAWDSAGWLGPSSPSAKCTRDVPGGDSVNGTGVFRGGSGGAGRLRSRERSRLRISGGGPCSTGPSAHAGQSPSGGRSAPHFRHLDTLT